MRTPSVEHVIAPAAIERALSIYQQLQQREESVILQARKIITSHVYGMVESGQCDPQRLVVGALARVKSVERGHDIKSAYNVAQKKRKNRTPVVGD